MPARLRRVQADDRGVSQVVGTAILVGITVLLVIVAAVLMNLQPSDRDRVESGGQASFDHQGYKVTPLGPEDIPVDGSSIEVVVDGVPQKVPLSALADQLEDPTVWRVGEPLCLVGEPPCLVPAGSEVSLTVIAPNNIVFQMTALRYVPCFSIGQGGGILVESDVPVKLRVLGVEITQGAGGPDIPVTLGVSIDGQAPFAPLFGGAAVAGGMQHNLGVVPTNSVLGVQGIADRNSFHSERVSFDSDPHVYVLRDGDAAPDFAPFDGQAPLEGFLAPYVDTTTGTVTLQPEEAIVLVEFVDDLSSSAADFQDLVVLFDFGASSCPSP